MKHILITGGAGFIGSHTADLLLQQGMQVIVFDNLTTGKVTNLNLSHPNFRFIQADILDYKTLLSEVNQCDVVLHLAALPSVTESMANPLQSLKVNTLGFLHVLQAIRETKKRIRLIYASSAAVYGYIDQLPCSDELPLPLKPLSPYALEKANNERYATLYAELFGIESLALRYFNVYGTRQDSNSPYSGVIAKFIDCYRKQTVITLYGNGQQSRDFIHVADVARANWLAIQSDYVGVLNIATSVPETLLNLINYIEQAGGHTVERTFLPAQLGDIAHSYASTLKSKRTLKFNYSIPLADGIRSFFADKNTLD